VALMGGKRTSAAEYPEPERKSGFVLVTGETFFLERPKVFTPVSMHEVLLRDAM